MISSKLPIPARVRSNLKALGCTGVVRGVCKGMVQWKVQGAAAGAQTTERQRELDADMAALPSQGYRGTGGEGQRAHQRWIL